MARPDPQELSAYLDSLLEQYPNVPKDVVERMIGTESGGNPAARSYKGAFGLMQLMPGTAREEGVTDPSDWRQNLRGGVSYLSKQIDRASREGGGIPNTSDGLMRTPDYVRRIAPDAPREVQLGVAAYHAGFGNVKKASEDAPAGGSYPTVRREIAAKTGEDDFWATHGAPVANYLPQQVQKPRSLWDDTKNLLAGGFDMAAQDFRELTRRALGDRVVGAIDSLGDVMGMKTPDQLAEEHQRALSEPMQAALAKKWDTLDADSAWFDPRSYYGGLMQSLPEQALTMLPAFRLGSIVQGRVYGAALKAGAEHGLSQEAAAKAAGELAAKWGERTAMAMGGGTEGLLAGAQSSREIRDFVDKLPEATLETSGAYQALLQQNGGDRAAARAALRDDAATQAFWLSGATTGAFGGVGDRILFRAFGKGLQGKLWQRMGKAAAAEGVAEEFPQSFLQAVSENLAKQKADPSVQTFDDALNQGLGGMAVGALQGGGMAAFSRRREEAPRTLDTPPAAAQPPAAAPPTPPAAAAPPVAAPAAPTAPQLAPAATPVEPSSTPPAAAPAADPFAPEPTEEEIAARMAATANMQDGDVGRPKDGAPFKAKIAAIGHASKAGLKDTHQVVQLGTDQYVLRPKAEEEDDGAPAAAKPPENIPQNIPESLTAQASAPAEEPVTVAPATPEAPGAAIPPQPETPPQQGGFDSDKFNKEREQRIAESRAAGNVHLDKLSPDVETMRGRSIYYVHDPKVRGTVRTVANTGEVVVNWSDQYSADKEMASEKQDGKKKVWQSWLMPSDLKDYAVAQAEAPSTPQPVTNQAPAGEQVVPEKQKKGGKAKTLGGRVIGDRVTSDVGEGTVVGFDGDQRLIVKKDDGETYYVPPAFAYDPGTPLPEEFDDAEPPKAEAPAAAPAKEEASKESGVVSISQELLATASDRNNAMRLGEAEYKKRVAGVKVFQHKGQDYVTVGSTGMGGGTVEVTAYNLVPVGTHKGNSPKWSYTGRRVKVGSKEFELGQPTNFVGPSGKSAVEIAQEKRDQEAKAAAASQEDDTTSDEGDDDRYGNRDRFKVGDRVVNANDRSDFFGAKGTVEYVGGEGGKRLIRFDPGTVDYLGLPVNVSLDYTDEYIAEGEKLPEREEQDRHGRIAKRVYMRDVAEKLGIKAKTDKQLQDALDKAGKAKIEKAARELSRKALAIGTPFEDSKVFDLTLDSGDKVHVEYESPRDSVGGSGHFAFHGDAISETGYRSDFFNAVTKDTPEEEAKLRAEAFAAEKLKRAAKAKPAKKSSPPEKPAKKSAKETLEAKKKGKVAPKVEPAEAPAAAPAGYGKSNKLVSEDAAEKARAILRAKLGNLNAGIDPEVLQAGTTLAIYHIEAGARAFADFTKAMIADMGEMVRPYLRSWYEGARYYPGLDTTGMSTAEEIDNPKAAEKPTAKAAEPTALTITDKGPWDFENTWPAPMPDEIRNKAGRDGFFDENGVGDTPEERAEAVASTLTETANEMMQMLQTIEVLQEALRTNIPPGGKKPVTGDKLAPQRKAWQQEIADARRDYQNMIASVEEYFPREAASAFGKWVGRQFGEQAKEERQHEATTGKNDPAYPRLKALFDADKPGATIRDMDKRIESVIGPQPKGNTVEWMARRGELEHALLADKVIDRSIAGFKRWEPPPPYQHSKREDIKPLEEKPSEIVNGNPPRADATGDERLLLMACSDKKLDKPAKAIDFYQGVMWDVLRKHMPTGKQTPTVAILSAKHGLLFGHEKVKPYDEKLTPAKADRLIKDGLPEGVEFDNVFKDVFIAGGQDYQRVMRQWVKQMKELGVVAPDASINATSGGIGEQRGQLGDYLRTIATPPPRERSAAQKANDEKLKKRAAAAKKINPESDSLNVAIIKKGGIDPKYRKDVTGDTTGSNPRVPFVGALFQKGGMGLDVLATDLMEWGYLTEEDIQDVDGGVGKLTELIQRELAGEPVYSTSRDMDAVRDAQAKAFEDAQLEQGAVDEAAQDGDDFLGIVTPDDLLADPENDASPQDLASADLVAQAAAIDEDAVERLANQHGDDLAGFMDAIRAFIKDHADDHTEVSSRSGESGLEPPAPSTAGEEEFNLAGQSNADILDAERAAADAARQSADEARAAELRAQADRERDSFALTGSDRTADTAAVAGQAGLFETPAPAAKPAAKPVVFTAPEPVATEEMRVGDKDYRITVYPYLGDLVYGVEVRKRERYQDGDSAAYWEKITGEQAPISVAKRGSAMVKNARAMNNDLLAAPAETPAPAAEAPAFDAAKEVADLEGKLTKAREDLGRAKEFAERNFVAILHGPVEKFGNKASRQARALADHAKRQPMIDRLQRKIDGMEAQIAQLREKHNLPAPVSIWSPEEQDQLATAKAAAEQLGNEFGMTRSTGNETAWFATADDRSFVKIRAHAQGLTVSSTHTWKDGAGTPNSVGSAETFKTADEARPYLAARIQWLKDNHGWGGVQSTEEAPNAASSSPDLEPDSGVRPSDSLWGEVPHAEPAADDGRAAAGVRPADEGGDVTGSGDLFPDAGPAAAGTESDQPVRAEQPADSGRAAGSDVGAGGSAYGDRGGPAESQADGRVADAARGSAKREDDRLARQKAAEGKPVITGDRDNIAETLPLLHPGQQDDVAFAEARFAKPAGYGVLFTNGTGTGKTFTGLGVIKRFAKQGKLNTIIIAPNDNVMQAWVRSGKLLGLDITPLESTKDAGRGIVVTTYANFGQNSEIHKRRWDLIVPDEAHYLSANQDGDLTSAGTMLRGLMYGRDWVYDLADARTIPLRAEMDAIKEELGDIFYTDPKYKALHEKYQAEVTRARNDVEATRPEERPRVLALSATPFAYQKSIEWGQGLLWDWNEGRENETTRSYNEPDGREAFFIQHFGYRMRYNKLTEPDKDVDRAVMEQEFNSWLKGEGVLSSRILDVDADYSRNFVTVEDAIGHKIDDGLEWLRKNIPPLYMLANDQFDYHSRMFLLESIKARAAVPLVKEQLAQGKKVVVFHDFNKGGGFHPFRFPEGIDSTVTWSEYENGQSTQKTAKLSDLVARFKAQRGDLWNLDFSKLAPPLMAFKAAFPDLLVVNGTETVKSRRAAVEKFNDDASGPQVILVQADAGKEGISLHDTTGQHQRVLFNLGLPIKPTQSVQQEGRIYRVGQVSDAPLVYFSTGTNFERWTFAHKVGSRAGTAENLAMGELARRLRESFTDGFQEARPFTPDMAEGKGGKEADRRVEPLSRWAKARSFYFGQQKKTSRNKAAEGIDYSATPEPLGLKMVEWANAKPAESVLEPSAGHGAIARWFPENLRRTLVEPSSELASRAALVVPGARIEQDHFENLHVGGNKFDAIVANPPFGKGGKTAYDHLAKAFQHLNDRGRLVFIVPDGPSANERWDKWYGSEAAAGAHLVAEISLPTVVFERAGTSVKAKVLVVDRYFDPKAIPGGGQQIRDYSDASDINDFFARIEHAEVKDRTEKPEASAPDANPAAAEAEQSALKLLPEDAPDVIRGPVQAMAARSQGEPTRFKNGETARKWSWSTPDRVKMPAVAVEHAKKWLQDQHAPSWRDGTAWIFKLELGDHVERSHSSRLTFRITKTGIEVTRTLYKYDDLPPADAAVPAPTSDLPGPTVPQTAAPANSVLEAVDTKHTKSGANVYVARMAVRVPDEEYRRLNQLAKAHGGYYSKFRGAGAIPGFLFTSSEQRNAFMTAAAQSGGISLDARDKFTDIVDRVLAGRPLYMGGANVLARLKRIERLLEEGKEYEARFEITRLIGAKSNSNKLAEERRDQPRVRGVEWAKERMIRAARQGDISHAQRDLALWLLERAPHLADDAALTVVSKSDRATAGSYNPYDRLITLVSGRGDATTAAHEFLHHAERMMPLDVQQGIREEWARQLVDFQTWGQSINSEIARRAVSDVLLMNAGDGEAQKRVIKMLRDGELPESFYALTNPSEFWAENGARILADRHDAKGWVAKARQWLAELVEKLKELVGLPSDAPVLRALRNIIDGDGKFQSPRMLWDDPNGTGLARSRADVYNAFDAAAVRQRVMDHLQSDKKISWWGKTIGTKYHIAQTVPEFKPVFDGVQRYLQDTSQFSIDAARYAPQLLPLLESGGEAFRDFTDILTGGAKTRRWRADQAAAGQAIFAGTLNDRVYSDAELARGHPNESRPPLSPEQIAMYHQARAAINRSLDDLAASEAARIMRTEKLQPPARAKLDPSTARATYAQAIRSLVELGMDPKEVKRIADQVDKVFERIQKLKAEGYAPLMRFGRYSIYVTDKRNPSGIGTADPEFYTFEAEADRNRFLRVLREDPEYRGAKLDHGVMPQKAYQLFEGLTPESLEMFIQATGLEADPLVQEYLKHVVATRSAMKRLIHRKGIEGYSGDLSRVLASFVTSNARLASRNYHASQLYEDSQKIRSGDVKDEASELIKYVFNPGDEAAGLRGLLFVNFLGGSFASAAVNMTQPVTMTLPYLAQFGGGARAASALLAQAKFAAGSKAGDPELQRAVDKATREGVVAPHEIHQLYAEAIRGMGGNIWWRRFLRVWGSMFSLAEAFNRKITFAAAYQMARETPGVMEKAGVSNAYDFAVKAVEDTQGIYNRGNRPTWARGAAGATIFTFKQFSIAYLEWFKRLPKQQQLLAVGVLILAAGLQGLPGADDLDDLVDTLGQWMGYATNSKAWKRKVLSDIFGETLGHGLLYGASGVNGMPFDVQARLGLGNLVPGTGLLKKSETDRGRQVAEIAGPLGGMLSNYAGAVSELASGDIGGALQKALPTAVSNAMKAVEMVQTGEYRDTKERRVIATTPADAAVKFLGFQPQDVAEASRKRGMVIQDVNLARNTEAAIADRWAHGVVDGKPDEVAQARLDLRAWNEKNPDLPIRINAGQINRRIREIKSEAAGRMIKSAPRELRDTVKERLL